MASKFKVITCQQNIEWLNAEVSKHLDEGWTLAGTGEARAIVNVNGFPWIMVTMIKFDG